jgi:mannose/fructose/N-acetylgalactosamine-specific phosphotransferase system component IID
VWAVLSLESWWVPLLLPLMFCLLALPARFFGLRLGYRYGDEATDLLVKINIAQITRNIKRTVGILIGASTVILLYTRTNLESFTVLDMWLAVLAVAVCVMFFRFLSARAVLLKYWYPLIFLLIGLAINMLH